MTNRVRHAGVFALYDWCWGGDDQWLYSETADKKLFSHDHGYYLPEVGHTWTQGTLVAKVDEPHQPSWPTDGMDAAELTRLTDRLRGLSADELARALQVIPTTWPVTDAELEAVGWFLHRRAEQVAARLESYV